MKTSGGEVGDWGEALHVGVSPWVAARPTEANIAGREHVCGSVVAWLERLGFHVERCGPSGGIVRASRAGTGRLRLGLIGHYDVEDAGSGWTYPSHEATRAGGRIFGRGLADNLGPLWLRLAAIDEHASDSTPSLLLVLQGEEEIGSPEAHQTFPKLQWPRVDLWLEETGYFELDGSQRILARNHDEATAPIVAAVERVAAGDGRASRRHDRFLNKALGPAQCPFLTHLVRDRPYLAIGPNDPASAIHRPDESLPEQNLELSVRQFRAVLTAASEID
ncbi:MAG: M20/M25/M40 family metallo-hydrolase [Archangium sp.]|nr:M20/M25/M40 family metallo-hydrolase [Archangium sp.]MDP3575345.1 M20/M25/M40 family metallo-hydrolase [Archangium sp.]